MHAPSRTFLRSRRCPTLLLVLGWIGGIGFPSCADGRPRPPQAPLAPGGTEMARMWTEPKDPRWKDYEDRIQDGKFQEAREVADAILADARKAGKVPEWTRALVRATAVRVALHEFETAVRFLLESPWPEDPVGRAVLGLYKAWVLGRWVDAYGWEIRQRERVESPDPLELKAWSIDRVHQAMMEGYGEAWQQRATLGRLPTRTWSEFLEVNTYPADIRPTLRDAVSYLFASALADSSSWTPRQSNEVFLLDLDALSGDAAKVPVPREDAHPLARMASVLADLESWHLREGRPQAALEAALERLRTLRAHFDQAEDRARIDGALDRRLRTAEGLPWQASALALQVEWRQEDPMALAQARDLARACAARWPDTPGGQRCAWWVGHLEQPSLSLAGMAVDGPGRRSLKVTHRNLSRVHFRAWPLDIDQAFQSMDDFSWIPDSREVETWIASRPPSHQWTVDLPPTPDLREHGTDVIPPMDRPGTWLVVASSDPSFGPSNLRAALVFTVSNLVVRYRPVAGALEVEVLAGTDGTAVAGAEVRLYRMDWRSPPRLEQTGITGADGVAAFPVASPADRYRLVMVRKGEDRTLGPMQGWFPRREEEPARTSALIYTDRSAYRPGQEVLFQVVAWHGRDGTFRTLPDRSLSVRLRDANRQVVETLALKTNRHGSASGRIRLPPGRMLGSWSLETDLGGQARIQVEEYKRPTFEVQVRDPDSPLRLNRPAEIRGDVRYYFGLPVTSGRVAWRVTREPQWPSWGWWWWRPAGPDRPQTIAAGTAPLDDEGSFRVAFTPAADERLGKGPGAPTWRYRLTVDVTDDGGETRSASRDFRLGFCSVEARIEVPSGFLEARTATEVQVFRQDLDGAPAPGEGTWRLVRLRPPDRPLLPADLPRDLPDQPSAVVTDGDRTRPRWETAYDPAQVIARWEPGEEVARGTVRHDLRGQARTTLPPLEGGAWRLFYRTHDPQGTPVETFADLVVAGTEVSPLPVAATLVAESPSILPGRNARLLVHSGFPGQRLVMERWRAGRRVDRLEWTAGPSPRIVEIPVRKEDRGGFSVTLTMVRDHQRIEITRDVFVPWEDRRLQVRLATFRDRLRPGSLETFTVRVSTAQGDAAVAAAEVLAYMYDRSLDLFAPHAPPDPLALYPRRTGVPAVFWFLREAPAIGLPWNPAREEIGLVGFQEDRLRFLDDWGIGGPGVRRHRGMGGGRGMVMMMAPPAPGAKRVAETASMRDEEDSMAEAPERAAVTAESPRSEPSSVRSDFRETAFFQPHLRTGGDGTVSLTFQVPDSVTSWKVFVHALTRDLKAGSTSAETRSVKDLMVRPYLPRFFREGDQAVLKVLVNNASDRPLTGSLDLEILDPDTGASRASEFGLAPGQARRSFEVAPGKGTDLSFPVRVPRRPGEVAVRVTASAGDLSDGEIRSLPVLPGRLHLAQSRFVTLRDASSRTMTFEDLLRDDDPTRTTEQVVVTGDAQLFYSVISALPYLVRYPYECSEQTLNRFVSTGILASLFDRYPEVARVAAGLAARKTRLEAFDATDPNRVMALEETPWVRESRGGEEDPDDLIPVLDPEVSRAQREASLARLRKIQTASGGFPWFPGGPPSPYLTLYIVHGLSRAVEFGVEVPRDLVQRAFAYLQRHYLDEAAREMRAHDVGWEFVTFLRFVLSSFPDDSWTGGAFPPEERAAMLDFGFRHWKEHSPYLKGYLALALHRAGRTADARKVWDSVLDSARTSEDLGTYWAPEDRAWLWYNDTIETHAFALRTTMELAPGDRRIEGMVQWLFLNRKLNHWKSTRATAEVLYALAHFLRTTGRLGVPEDLAIDLGGRVTTFRFDPDRYTGRRQQVVLPGDAVVPKRDGVIRVSSTTPGFKFASATWHYATDRLPEEGRGDLLAVERSYFRRDISGGEVVLRPLGPGDTVAVGDEVEVHLSIRAKHAMEYVHLRDPRGAGLEPVDQTSRYRWQGGLGYYEEVRDSGQNFFLEWMPAGEYRLKYRLRAAMAGSFRVGPATLQSMYAPEFQAFSSGTLLDIAPPTP